MEIRKANPTTANDDIRKGLDQRLTEANSNAAKARENLANIMKYITAATSDSRAVAVLDHQQFIIDPTDESKTIKIDFCDFTEQSMHQVALSNMKTESPNSFRQLGNFWQRNKYAIIGGV